MTRIHRSPLTLLSALLCLTLGQLLFMVQTPPNIDSLVWPGIGLYLLGSVLALRFFRLEPSSPVLERSRWEPSSRTQLWCALGLALFAGVLRVAWLDRLPFTVDGDAAAFAVGALEFLRPDRPSLVGTGWQSHTNVYFFLVSRMLLLFGRSVVAIRSLSALGGTLGVVAVFALGRALWGFRVGLFAGLALAVQPFDLVFSRVGTEVVHLTWLLPLVILSIWEGWRRAHWGLLLLGGMITGLSQYFYPGARLIPLLAIGQIGLLALWPSSGRRDLRRGLQALAMLVLGVLLVYGPMIPHFLRYPDAYTARLKLVSITSSGWLTNQLAQHPWWQVIGGQIWRAYLPFHFPVNGPPLWYKWPQYLSPFDASLLWLGLIGVWFGRGSALWLRLYLAAYLLGGIVLAGVLTRDSPMPSRYIVFMPGVALLIGYALDQLFQQWLALIGQAQGDTRRRLALALVAAALCVYCGIGLGTYLQHDTVLVEQDDPTNQQASYAARYLQTLPDQNFDILFLKTRLIYYQASPVLSFLTSKTGENIEQPLDCSVLTQHLSRRGTVVLAPPGRVGELRQMQERINGANLAVFSNRRAEPVAGVLVLPPPPPGSTLPCTTPAVVAP